MAGIYIHIPFCRKACHYCNFHFSTSLELKNDFIAALLKEIALQQDYLTNAPVETIYFGGGTPSLLSSNHIATILDAITNCYLVAANAECTLEANPDDITHLRLQEWKACGVNRLSIGVQSFFDDDLIWMNRVHQAAQAKEAILLSREAGIDNITIDLIYGGPTLDDKKWEANVETALSLQVPHLSCYALTVEPNTALQKMIQQQKKEAVDSDKQARQFQWLMDRLAVAGYEHYEISNFALPGRRSRHNSSYWQGKPYLGLGPSAHSYNGTGRRWNISNNALYIQSLQKNQLIFEEEILTPAQQLNEYVMTSLRTTEGLNLELVADKFGVVHRDRISELCRSFIRDNNMLVSGNFLILTNTGKLLADGIAAALFA